MLKNSTVGPIYILQYVAQTLESVGKIQHNLTVYFSIAECENSIESTVYTGKNNSVLAIIELENAKESI